MRKLLFLLFSAILLGACSSGDDSSTTNEDSTEAETPTNPELDHDEQKSPDATDDTNESVVSGTGEYERVHDITEITGDDRFISLGGTIIDMSELDQVIENNDIFNLSAVRSIIFAEEYYIYQLEFELNVEDSVTVAITEAEVDGADVTTLTALDYGQILYVEDFETEYITIYFHNFEEAVPDVNELKVQVDVSKSGEYETIGEYEFVLEF